MSTSKVVQFLQETEARAKIQTDVSSRYRPKQDTNQSLISRISKERDEALIEIDRLNERINFLQTENTRLKEQAVKPIPPTPSILPIEKKKVEENDQDGTSLRFSLLELD